MTKCKQAIGGSSCGKDICCFECEDKLNCEAACININMMSDASGCEDAIVEENMMVVFEQQTLTIMQKIKDITMQKKALEETEKTMRTALEEAMQKYGVTSFENNIVKITYVEPTTKTSVDSKKLKAEHPDVYAQCTKVSDVKGSVRITVK